MEDLSLPANPSAWNPTPKELCVETSDRVILNSDTFIDDGYVAYIFFGLWHYRNRLHHFCIEVTLTDRSTGERRILERVDTCHKKVHRHKFAGSDSPDDHLGRVGKETPYGPNDHSLLSDHYDSEYARLTEQWREILGRWKRS